MNMSSRRRLATGFVIAFHALLILAAYSSPFWLDWKLLACGIGVYWLQLLIFKHCVLSTAQFGDKETTFHEWYLAKLGFHPDHATFKRLLNLWAPLLLIALAVLIQVVLKLEPLIYLTI